MTSESITAKSKAKKSVDQQSEVVDYSKTLFLPKTGFPMRGNLPNREPGFLARWEEIGLHDRIRDKLAQNEKYILHDGPPYANENLHLGHALNKILKDFIIRSRQMAGYNAPFVQGWDCHGLPIEWMVEQEQRKKGLNKEQITTIDFRQLCRDYAGHWLNVQKQQVKRLGVSGNFNNYYSTMSFASEAAIAEELLKIARQDLLYRQAQPVMWSVVEKTVLAEAEIEYEEYKSDAIWVKFPVIDPAPLAISGDVSVVIWTTTPWTIPGNRAISFSAKVSYSLYKVNAVAEDIDNNIDIGEYLLIADELADAVMAVAGITDYQRVMTVKPEVLAAMNCFHPLKKLGYDFKVPFLPGDHVTADEGTGFVHTAPGHGRDDFDIWFANKQLLLDQGISLAIPDTVDDNGVMTEAAFGFAGAAVITASGEKGDANKRVINALLTAKALLALRTHKHQYPHSWRSKKPIIFRNIPQWFIALDKPFNLPGDVQPLSLRDRALAAIDATSFIPESGYNRLRSMVSARPDWVISRQRSWGVPIALFIYQGKDETRQNEILRDERVNQRILAAFSEHGADCWFADDAKQRFLGADYNHDDWFKIDDILDVWFESGSTHAFVLKDNPELRWPADVYIEGSDQHRGWFHSSLLESCATMARAPYDMIITHGFITDQNGRKLSKSRGNGIKLEDIIKRSGVDIIRLWVAGSDYTEDFRIGRESLDNVVEAYRKLRNTLRWMLGNLHHYDFAAPALDLEDMPELERYMLHLLHSAGKKVADGYDRFEFKLVLNTIINFVNIDLSAFYFDIRKDALYCDAYSSSRRQMAIYVIDQIFQTIVKWLAPLLPFTCEEAWLGRHGDDAANSIHLEDMPKLPRQWQDDTVAAKWAKVRELRRVITGALEIARRDKKIGSSLDAAPVVYVRDSELRHIGASVDMADIVITSNLSWGEGEAPATAFTLDDVPGVAVEIAMAAGNKCARSWRILPEVGQDKEYPDLSLRDAAAMREFKQREAIKSD